MRRDHQYGALAQDPSARIIGERDAPELAAVNVRNVIVPCETLIKERVVGGHEIQNIPIFFNDALEKQQRFLLERLAQIVIEVRKLFRKRLHVFQIPQVQPLTGERRRESFSLGVGNHSANLPLEDGRVMQHPLVRRLY